jgi:uncharacterized repeat protein (TIGR03803 family)
MKLASIVTGAILTLSLFSMFLLFAARPAQAHTETVLYNFTDGSDGAYPEQTLTSDHAGNFYGTTLSGGLGYGIVFELSPKGSGGWNEIVLYSFTGGEDGANPSGPLIFDSVGNLFGTASGGGTYGDGVVFELSPLGTGWRESVLHDFAGGADGKFPISGVIFDAAGNLYGTTYNGWKTATIFEMSPSGSGWTEQVIYAVETSGAGLTMDAAGNIFSATYSEVFELSPNGNGGWTPTVIHTFTAYPKDGYYADTAPVLDKAGNIYGTTLEGGPDNGGTVYRLRPEKKGKWTETILHSFKGFKHGNAPVAGIVFDEAGNIYGTTLWGGSQDWGTVFELVAPVGKGGYEEKILWSFTGADGLGPYAGVILDSAGNLYGATYKGGTTYGDNYGYGVVFEVTP